MEISDVLMLAADAFCMFFLDCVVAFVVAFVVSDRVLCIAVNESCSVCVSLLSEASTVSFDTDSSNSDAVASFSFNSSIEYALLIFALSTVFDSVASAASAVVVNTWEHSNNVITNKIILRLG